MTTFCGNYICYMEEECVFLSVPQLKNRREVSRDLWSPISRVWFVSNFILLSLFVLNPVHSKIVALNTNHFISFQQAEAEKTHASMYGSYRRIDRDRTNWRCSPSSSSSGQTQRRISSAWDAPWQVNDTIKRLRQSVREVLYISHDINNTRLTWNM